MATLIEVDEVHEHAGVFLVEKLGKDTHAFLDSTGSQFGDFGRTEPC